MGTSSTQRRQGETHVPSKASEFNMVAELSHDNWATTSVQHQAQTTRQRHQSQCRTTGQRHQPTMPRWTHGSPPRGQRHQFSSGIRQQLGNDIRFRNVLAQRLSSHHLRSSSINSMQHSFAAKTKNSISSNSSSSSSRSSSSIPNSNNFPGVCEATRYNRPVAQRPPPQTPINTTTTQQAPVDPKGGPPRGHQQQQQLGNDIRFRITQRRIGSTSWWTLRESTERTSTTTGQRHQIQNQTVQAQSGQLGNDIRFRGSATTNSYNNNNERRRMVDNKVRNKNMDNDGLNNNT